MKAICSGVIAFCVGLAELRGIASEPPAQLKTKEDAPLEFVQPYTAKQKAWALLEIPRGTEARFTGKPNAKVELRDYSITLDSKGKYIPAFPHPVQTGTVCGYRPPTSSTSYYPVTRPGGSNFVAVIKTIGDRSVVLNPIQGFDYGPIPLLTSLTVEQADELWGKAIKEEIASEFWRQKTYELESININGISKKFLLFCSFGNGKLSGYKISGRAIKGVLSSFVMDERSIRY